MAVATSTLFRPPAMEGDEINLGQFLAVSNRNTPSDPSVGIVPQNIGFLQRTLPQENRMTLSTAAQDATTNPNYYPLPIAPEKIERALDLYTRYLDAVALKAAPDSALSATRYLDAVALKAAPGSAPSANDKILSSTRSEQRGTSVSISTSAYSELSSVTTFGEGTGDMRRLPTRVRRTLSPSARTKAALLRYLGSCAPCRSRHLPCPLGHHNIEILENFRLAPHKGDRGETATTSAFDRVDPDEAVHRSHNFNIQQADDTSTTSLPEQQNSPGTHRNPDATTARTFLSHQANPENATKCKLCWILFISWFVIIAGSVVIGLWRSIAMADEGKGFTDAAYIVDVGGAILYPVQNRHASR